MKIYIIKKSVPIEIMDNYIKYIDIKTLPIVDIVNKNIKYNYSYYKHIIKKDKLFEEQMYIIKEIFGAFVSNDMNIDINIIKYKKCDLEYIIKLKPEYEIGEKINPGTYTPDFRFSLEIIGRTFKPKNVVFIGNQRFMLEAVGLLRSNKIKMNIHCYDKFEYTLHDKRLYRIDDKYYNDPNFYKYIQLNKAIDNLSQFSKDSNIYIKYSIDYIESLVNMIESRIIPDVVILQHIDDKDYKLIINKLLEYNKNIIIICRVFNILSKEVILDKSNSFNPIIIPDVDNIYESIRTFKKKNESTTFIITNRIFEYNKYLFKCPISYFDDYKILENRLINKHLEVKLKHYLKKDIVKICDINFTKDYVIKKYNYLYNEYKKDLDLLDKYINNDYIFIIFLLFVIKIGNLFFILNSNINIYECVFLNNLIDNYIFTNNKNKYNIVEIGCAYGISGMIMVNSFNKYENKKFNFWSIDPNQKAQWHNVGNYNINKVKKDNTKWNLVEKYSDEGLTYIKEDKINRKIDICFIDGAHDYINVYSDITIIDTFLEIGGLIILDDVLHQGVRDSVLKFYNKYNNKYIRLYYDNNGKINLINKVYNTFTRKSIYDPSSMYCFMKIK